MRALAGAALLSLASCGSVPTRKFTLDVIDAEEAARPCLVVVNQDWVGADRNQQYVNVTSDDELTLEITFDRSDVEITIAPVRVENGKPTKVPARASEVESGYVTKSRLVKATDAERQLFIITRK